MSNHVYVLANDVVPGSSMPVAAPGLRAAGLATGLKAHGIAATLVTPVGRGPTPWQSPIPAPSQPGTAVVRPVDMADFFAARAPATVIITNSNQYERVAGIDGLTIVFDMFAPKVLELECARPPASAEAIAKLRQRKATALAGSDAYIVNGAKKVPYLHDWLAKAGVDPAASLIVTVNMAVPVRHPETWVRTGGAVRLLVAGYQQPWSAPGEWLETVYSRLSADMRLSILRPRHWGSRGAGPGNESAPGAPYARWVDVLGASLFDDFAATIAAHDVVVDLFDDTAERRLAMVTRTVVALASGAPVIHPPWTEVSPLIESYDAGWLIEPADTATLKAVLHEIATAPDVVAAKTANAKRLAEATFAPAAAAEPLVELLTTLDERTPS